MKLLLAVWLWAAGAGSGREDLCASFNRGEAERRANHKGPCPYCPCSCVNGRPTCAPCVRCDPARVDPYSDLEPSPRRPPDAGSPRRGAKGRPDGGT